MNTKSSCCGAETYIHKDYVEGAHAFMETGEMCPVCQEYCDTIPSDLWCKKEILEFCEKWEDSIFDETNYPLLIILKSINKEVYVDSRTWKNLQEFLKSVKIVMEK